MSNEKIARQNEIKKKKSYESLLSDSSFTQKDTEVLKIILEEEPNIFLLNNLLMSVQFFENYERDVELLRENWFKEVLLESHYKKCFFADSLFRLSEANVKFVPRHGLNKNVKVPLHPFRIYISSDNVEAAYDPSFLNRNKFNQKPGYQFTVKTNEAYEKLGYISLVEFKRVEAPIKSIRTKTPTNNIFFHNAVNENKTENSNYFQRKSIFEEKFNRRLTKTEKFISSQNRQINIKMVGKNSLKYCASSNEGVISVDGFYKYTSPEARLKHRIIQDFRMNSTLATSYEIPLECFQREDVKKKLNTRRSVLYECFRSQRILNSAAFKGYFCDLLIDKLSEPLSLDSNAVNEALILEEFIIVKEKETQYCFTPIIKIKDWSNYIFINKSFRKLKTKQMSWPSDQMQKIINILPCNAVPIGYFSAAEEDMDYEKTWKLVFPKTEEFLLLHMMHAHIRCYFFVVLLYKTFIETEINSASFGTKHLLHLLFWRVHKNFLAWPEDRPGETLLSYLKALYKKLQKKSLSDFFITSRNLFANSLAKDLHKAQVLIKKIIENPVLYVMKAIRNLYFNTNFYPGFDILKLNTILHATNIFEKLKKTIKLKKQKLVCQEDEDQRWKKIAMKQIHLERKAQEEEESRKESIESINVEKILNFNSQDYDKCNQILEMFTSHFIEMARKSLQYNFLSQAFFYLNQTQTLNELSAGTGMNAKNRKATRQKIDEIKKVCDSKLQQNVMKWSSREKKLQKVSNIMEENKKNKMKMVAVTQNNLTEMEVKTESENEENVDSDQELIDENEVISVKL